jgi:hypothetical protein
MDKSAEMKVTIPRVDKGTESVGFTESPLEKTRSLISEGLGNPWNECQKKVEKLNGW